jgi:hypothetical protein
MLNIKEEKGISLVFVMMIISVILNIAFGMSSILMTQISTLREIGYSVVAFYAADSGLEQFLLTNEAIESELDNGAIFKVEMMAGGDNGCDPIFNYCIKSVGEYNTAKRAIEVVY